MGQNQPAPKNIQKELCLWHGECSWPSPRVLKDSFSSVIQHTYSNHMSNVGNSMLTTTKSTNLGRSHRLNHVCTEMMRGKFEGYRSIAYIKETEACAQAHKHDITLKGGIVIWEAPMDYLLFVQLERPCPSVTCFRICIRNIFQDIGYIV